MKFSRKFTLTVEEIEESERFKEQKMGVRITTAGIRVVTALEIAMIVLYYLVTGIFFTTLPPHFHYSAIFLISFAILLIATTIYFCFIHAKHRFSLFFILAIGYIVIAETIWGPFLEDNEVFGQWTPIGIMYYACLAIFLVGIGFMVAHLFTVSYARISQFNRERRLLPKMQKIKKSKHLSQLGQRAFQYGFQKKKLAHLIFIPMIAASGFLAAATYFNWFTGNSTVTITPGDYDIEIAMFTRLNPSAYQTSWRENMDDHSVLIITHDTPVLISPTTWNENPFTWIENQTTTTEYINAKNSFINQCNDWKNNYPNVRIMPAVLGVPCGFPTDFSVTNGSHGVGGTLWMAKQYLQIAVDNNLTNVVGIHADQESCQDNWDVDYNRSRERNEQATANWNAFFQDINASYSEPDWQSFFSTNPNGNKFIFQTTFGTVSALDAYDGDNDLDVMATNNILGVPYWGDYTPMLYHSGSDTTDEAHFKLYNDMLVLNDGLAYAGLEDRIGAYLGITGLELFSYETQTQFNGTSYETVTGYDVLVRQGLIVKSFNAPRVTIFLGTTAYDGQWMYGVFDTYGDDFLDQYNASLNGPGGDQPFNIKTIYSADQFHEKITRDLFLSEWLHFEFILGVAIAISIIIGFISDANIWKKITGKAARNIKNKG